MKNSRPLFYLTTLKSAAWGHDPRTYTDIWSHWVLNRRATWGGMNDWQQSRHRVYLGLLVRLHQRVPQNLVIKIRNVGGVAPRLETNLLLHRLGKAAKPSLSRKCINDILPGDSMHKVLDVGQVRVVADIVIDGGQLNHLPQKGNVAVGAQVLVADDGFADGIGLVLCRSKVLQDPAGFEAAIELKRHAGCRHVLFGGANVVEKGREGESRWGEALDMLGKLLPDNGSCYGCSC